MVAVAAVAMQPPQVNVDKTIGLALKSLKQGSISEVRKILSGYPAKNVASDVTILGLYARGEWGQIALNTSAVGFTNSEFWRCYGWFSPEGEGYGLFGHLFPYARSTSVNFDASGFSLKSPMDPSMQKFSVYDIGKYRFIVSRGSAKLGYFFRKGIISEEEGGKDKFITPVEERFLQFSPSIEAYSKLIPKCKSLLGATPEEVALKLGAPKDTLSSGWYWWALEGTVWKVALRFDFREVSKVNMASLSIKDSALSFAKSLGLSPRNWVIYNASIDSSGYQDRKRKFDDVRGKYEPSTELLLVWQEKVGEHFLWHRIDFTVNAQAFERKQTFEPSTGQYKNAVKFNSGVRATKIIGGLSISFDKPQEDYARRTALLADR